MYKRLILGSFICPNLEIIAIAVHMNGILFVLFKIYFLNTFLKLDSIENRYSVWLLLKASNVIDRLGIN